MPEPQSFLITDLINDVKRGYIKTPQFQRDFIWPKQKAASLMDSILKGILGTSYNLSVKFLMHKL